MSSFNPIAHFLAGTMPSQAELDEKMRARVAENAINAQKAQDEHLGPDKRALDAYIRYESRNFNKFQYKLSALKNKDHGIICHWRAAAAYANTECETRDALIAKIKAEK